MFKEFKEFALKGNAFNLAVGVIIGGAFQKIINSLVSDIIMPCISIFTGTVDYSNLTLTVNNANIKYGSFVTAVIDFFIIAISIFLAVKYINRFNEKFEKAKMETLNNKLIQKAKQEALNSEFIKKALSNKKKKKEKPEPEPTTQLCPFCFSEINIKATRCPRCTSEITKPEPKNDIIEEQLEIDTLDKTNNE